MRTNDAPTGIDKIFDANRVQKEIDAQAQITQLFGQKASQAVGDYAQEKMREATQLRLQGKIAEAEAIEAQWGSSGSLRLAAHTAIGALTGGTSVACRMATFETAGAPSLPGCVGRKAVQ